MGKRKTKFAVGVRVRLKGDPAVRIGVIIGKYNQPTWWKVFWPDGSTKLYPQRQLELVR